MSSLHPRAVGARSRVLILLGAVVLAACSSDASDVFGESSSAAPSSGPGGGGDGGAGAGTPATTSTTGGGAGAVTSGATTGATTGTTTGGGGDGGAGGGAGGEGPTTTAGPTSTAAGASCGNGAIDGDELCDGADLGGATCASLGVPGPGEPLCVDCAYDTSECQRCGNGDLDPNEDCDDGGQADGDGCDASCRFEGLTCQSPIDVAIDVGETVSITTTNADGPMAPGTCENATGRGRVIRVSPQSGGFLTAWIRRDGTTFDSTLRMGYGCGQDILVCADSYDPGAQQHPPGGEVGSMRVPADSEVFIHVNAWSPADEGDFTVEIALSRARCDDPIVVPVEPGSGSGIVLVGLNGGAGNDTVGSCGGNGEDVTYELVPVGAASPVDATLTPLQGYFYNPVLHARAGACDDQEDEIECSAQTGYGQAEVMEGLSITSGAFLHADAAGGSSGGYRLRIVPPEP